MKQTQKTRVVSGRRRGDSVLARERKGSGSHSGDREWRRALWRERESDISHLHLGRSGTCQQRENTGTVAKQKQLPSAS